MPWDEEGWGPSRHAHVKIEPIRYPLPGVPAAGGRLPRIGNAGYQSRFAIALHSHGTGLAVIGGVRTAFRPDFYETGVRDMRSSHAGHAVIVVEHKLLQLFVAELMRTADLEVIAAANADEAVSILESRSDIKLLVTNVVMQGRMDGVELSHVVDIRWPSVKIIVVSGKRGLMESDLPKKCVLLTKPYHDDELIFEIRSLIGA